MWGDSNLVQETACAALKEVAFALFGLLGPIDNLLPGWSVNEAIGSPPGDGEGFSCHCGQFYSLFVCFLQR